MRTRIVRPGDGAGNATAVLLGAELANGGEHAVAFARFHEEVLGAALDGLEDNLLLCQGRSTTGETSFMLRTESAQLTFCLWAAHRNPTHPQVPALLDALSADPSSPLSL